MILEASFILGIVRAVNARDRQQSKRPPPQALTGGKTAVSRLSGVRFEKSGWRLERSNSDSTPPCLGTLQLAVCIREAKLVAKIPVALGHGCVGGTFPGVDTSTRKADRVTAQMLFGLFESH